MTGPKNVEAIKTKERIKKFEDSTKLYLMEMKKESFFIYATGVPKAKERLKEVKV